MVKVILKSIRGDSFIFPELDEDLTVAEFRGVADKKLEHTFVPKFSEKWSNYDIYDKHANNMHNESKI